MGDRIATGIVGFDRLVGGGIPRGTVNLVSGPAGSGKSLFALHFVVNGARLYAEPGIYLVLEETRENLERALRSYGLETADLEAAGTLYFVDMGELQEDDEEHGVVGFDDLRDFLSAALVKTRAKRLVVDSLSVVGLHYASADKLRERFFTFARFLRSKDVCSLLLTEAIEGGALTRFGIEQFVCDSFVHLGLEEVKGDLRRTLTVRKMRFTRHDASKHPFHITSNGMVVLDQEKVV